MSLPLYKWFNHVETWPIIAVGVGAASMCSFFMYRTITSNPDISVDKMNRGTAIRTNPAEGEHFVKGNWIRNHVQGRPQGIFTGLNKFMSNPNIGKEN